MTRLNLDGIKEIPCVGNFYPYRVEWGPSDSFFGALLQFKDKNVELDEQHANIFFDGDIRDAGIIKNLSGKRGLVISRNDDKADVFSY